MASNREERRLQRSRGAQRHQVQDIDFALSIPAPPAPRSGRRQTTPQPELHTQSSSRRTPKTRSSQKRNAPKNASSSNANTSAKRRKLEVPVPSSSRSTRSSGNPPRPDIYDLPEEEEQQPTSAPPQDEDELAEETPVQTVKTPRSVYKTASPSPSALVDEVSESPRNAPGSGQRQWIGALGGMRLPSKRRHDNLDDSDILADSTPSAKGRRPRAAKQVSSTAEHTRPSPELTSQTPQLGLSLESQALDELSPDQPVPRRRGRPPNLREKQFSGVEAEAPDTAEEAEEIDDNQAAKQLLKRRGRKSKRVTAQEAAKDAEAAILKSPVLPQVKPRKRTLPKASPAVQRQGKKSKATKSVMTSLSRDAISITVYRMTKPLVFDGDDSEADILNADIPAAKRSGVNVVDVLSQMCEEIIGAAKNNLEEGGQNAEDSSARREYRIKLKAVKEFQEALRARLLELTIALDFKYALTKRVRSSQRERNELRTELLRLRAEREQVALRMDTVRINHESSSNEAQEQSTLSTAINDIELAVLTARDNPVASDEPSVPLLSTLIASVASDASSKSNGGGILNRMKEFNDFLERAAMALEGRI